MLQEIKTTLTRNLTNARGWRTNRKIVVFESDDWGSIRMPSKEVFEKLRGEGIRVHNCPYMRNDGLASSEDLDMLFQTLKGTKDNRGNHPVFTFNTVVANPLFEKIKENNFQTYYYEPFTDTLKKKNNTLNSFELWKQGMDERLIAPEFHGREHLNVKNWLKILNKKQHPEFLKLFKYNCWGIGPTILKDTPFNIQASFDAKNKQDIEYQKRIIKEGLTLFKNIFDFHAISFTPNNYVFSNRLNKTLEENGIKYIQGNYYQLDPNVLNGKKDKKIRYTGMKSGEYLINQVRNCFFEPFENSSSLDSCLKQISNAFFWKKPAIIATHRANYIGSINERNRNDNIRLLNQLLNTIVKKWPDVIFLSSRELGNIISKE